MPHVSGHSPHGGSWSSIPKPPKPKSSVHQGPPGGSGGYQPPSQTGSPHGGFNVSTPVVTKSQADSGGRPGGAYETEQAGKAYEEFKKTMQAGDNVSGLTDKQIADAYIDKVLGGKDIKDVSGIETVDYTSDKKAPDE